MIFPIGDDNIEGGHKPIFAYTLLLLNVGIFILYWVSLDTDYIAALLNDFGVIPEEIVRGQDLYSLVTSMFLHAGLMHLLGNALFLWIFADNIEAIVGNLRFILFYLGGGLFASFVHIGVDPDSVIPTVGASGAISAVMGCYLVMFPKSRIKLLFIIKTFYVSALLFLGFWFAQQIFSGVITINAANAEEAGGVAWWAHIGGFVYGLFFGWLFKQRFGRTYSYDTV